MYKLLTNNFTVVKHLYSNVTLLAVRGEYTISNCTEAIIGKCPANTLFRKLCGRTCSIYTLCGNSGRSCRSVIIVLGIKNSVIELTCSLCLRYDNNTVNGSALRTVGRNRTHSGFTFTLTLRNEGRRSTTVTVYCVYAAERKHHFTQLIVRKTGRYRSITSVNQAEYESTICLNTNH